MKKIITTLLFVLPVLVSSAQYLDSLEVKGKDYVYKKYILKSHYTIHNKHISIRNQKRDVPEYGLGKVTIQNSEVIDSLVKKHFTPYLKDTNFQFRHNQDCLWIGLFSDRQGNIKDINFYYPKEYNLPIEALEAFEKELKGRSEVKLLFDYQSPALKTVPWVSASWVEYYEVIKKL